MKSAKCPSCGANITVDETKDAGICEFCNTPFITEKAISQTNNTTTNNAQTINYYYGSNESSRNVRVPKTERPVLNVGLAIFLCFFYIFPGLIYIASVKKRQKEWDDKYTY